MKTITEEKDQATLDEWAAQAKGMTLAALPEFLRHLIEDYRHDYGTICHALAIGAVATCWALNKGPQGGITGFQGGAVMWEFMRRWNGVDFPSRLVRYENMLYPQYDDTFAQTITADTFAWLQKEARQKLLERDGASANVKAHWQNIVDGKVPFGYRVVGD